MSEPEIPYRSIRELGRANRTGETGPVALTTLLLDRIADLNPVFHALAAAKAADSLIELSLAAEHLSSQVHELTVAR